MKVYIAILFSLVFTSVYNFDYEKISMNSPLTAKSDKDSLQFYQLSLNDVKTKPNEIKIETQILDSKNSSSSTIGVHYQPFKKTNFNQIKKEVLGKPLIHSLLHGKRLVVFPLYRPHLFIYSMEMTTFALEK